MHKVIVKAWIRKDNKFLLAKRSSTEKHHAGVWSLPGGNIENDVCDLILENSLNKEIKEEIGIEIKPEIFITYNNGFIKDSDGSHVINVTFLCDWKSGEARPLEDTSEIEWFTLNELKKINNPSDFLSKEIEYLVKYLKKYV